MLLIFLKIERSWENIAGEKVKGAPLQTSPPKELTEEERTCKGHSALFQLERIKQGVLQIFSHTPQRGRQKSR